MAKKLLFLANFCAVIMALSILLPFLPILNIELNLPGGLYDAMFWIGLTSMLSFWMLHKKFKKNEENEQSIPLEH